MISLKSCGEESVIAPAAKRRDDVAIAPNRDGGAHGAKKASQSVSICSRGSVSRWRGSRADHGWLGVLKRLMELCGEEAGPSVSTRIMTARFARPRVIAEDGATVPMSRTVSNDLPASRRILVIDDDHDVADSLVMFLETFGADVRVAYDGEGGVSAVREFRPELIFLDLGMPKLDGYETARRIRALPEGRDVKLVALSGWGQGQVREQAREAGFDRQLTKPAGIEALQELLNDL